MDNIFRTKTKMVLPNGEVQESEQFLLKETHLKLNISDGSCINIVCTNTAVKELIIGRLFCEGLIGTTNDVSDIAIKEGNDTDLVADVTLESCDVKRPNYNRDEFASFSSKDIFEIISSFEKGGDLHGVTKSAHSCYISVDGKTVWNCEDISRHNAIDKCIGYMLINDMDSKDCIVYTSGRVPLDMITKADQAGIRVLVAKAIPTDKAIDFARKNKIVLIARARSDHFEVFVDK